MSEQQTTVAAKLALHQSQRCQSIPTLSVLMGKAITVRQTWAQWLNKAHRQTTVCVYKSRVSLSKAWLSTVVQHYDLRSLVIQRIATRVNQPVDRLADWFAHTSDYQIQLFWQQVSPLSDEARVLRSLLDTLSPAQTPDQQAKDASARWLQQENPSTAFVNLAVIARLLPPRSMPGLLVLLPDNDGAVASTALTALTQLVEVVPILPIALGLTAAQGKHLLDQFPESRAKAILRSGLIEVLTPEPESLMQWLGDRGMQDEHHLQPILRVAEQYGTTTELMETAVALVVSTSQPDSAEADIVYRSQAERFLFQILEAKPTTVGRFQVNARLDINFGDRRMEVDFLDAEAKIVIELDGHYHFKSLDNYRRDRRKDRILQQQGFMVLRFLSEDVVKDLEGILDAVDQALVSRQSSATYSSEA
ncbi:endonuclease domain-containing protein [Vacuolonema iberomarrocanum]|uniref:endonuclease domain-containing protein n=1 Tax=Vacuolonema iberomarrocanum TaxID=3454632 RepID=UPI003F6DDB9E